MSSPLFENEHVQVLALAGEPIVLVVRKPTRVELGELDRVWGAAERALAAVARRYSCLLIDVSAAVGRNDENFERAFAPFRQRLSSDWLEMALVVSTVPGKLQVQRYAKEDAARVSVFDNREAALTALRRAARGK
ncbi:MAG TPA: hypothetical protein VMI54_01845 [Polyangiaceae bacterium]|nr:hypothetical protein [Polyangiaceae bacterium]